MKTMKTLITAIAVIITCQLASAQTTAPDSVTTNFIRNANLGGLKEINAGQLAVRKAKSFSVKAYGAKMIADHTKANNRLRTLARSKGYTVPVPASAELAAPAMLANATGTTFDKNYVSMMLVDHQNTIKIFENAQLNSADPDIKKFAEQTLPTLRAHLASIQSIAANMGVSVQ